MTTEYFKVRNGLSIGEDTFTVDASTGDTVIAGNLTVNGDTTTLNTTELQVEDNKITLNSNVTDTPGLDAGIEVERGSATNSAITWNETSDKWEQNRAGTSTVIAINTDELTEGSTNLYYTSARTNADFDTRLATKTTDNINEGSTNQYFTNTRARSSISVTDAGGDGSLSYNSSTGVITYTGATDAEVRARFSAGTGVTYNSGTGQISIGQDVATTANPTFAGVTGGNISVGVSTDNTIATTNTNGDLTLAPNGTGDMVITFSNGGNLSNNRNYVMGTIRNSTTESIGDIWAVNSTGPSSPFRGISLDNSADTTKGPGTVLRSFSGGAVAGSATRGRLVFEKARGTSASPTAVQAGDFIGSVDATGYTSTGWINDNVVSTVPAFFGFVATENWVSNTNLGTQFTLSLLPVATTITSGAQSIPTFQSSPQTNILRADAVAIGQGKTAAFTATGCSTSGTTLTIGTLTSGTIAVGQVLNATVTSLNGLYIVANISGSGSGSTWTLSASPGTTSGQALTGNAGVLGSANATTVDALADLKLITNKIKNSSGTTCITTSATNTTFALPVGFPVYTVAGKPASGSVGQQICISDSASGSNPNGMMAFWDTTNSRWSYIHDNSAV